MPHLCIDHYLQAVVVLSQCVTLKILGLARKRVETRVNSTAEYKSRPGRPHPSHRQSSSHHPTFLYLHDTNIYESRNRLSFSDSLGHLTLCPVFRISLIQREIMLPITQCLNDRFPGPNCVTPFVPTIPEILVLGRLSSRWDGIHAFEVF